MKKRFIIILGAGAIASHHDAFRAFLKSSYPDLGWWHRVPDTWLVIDLGGSGSGLTATILRDAVMACFPGVHCLVLAFYKDGSSTWSGFGPTEGTLDWFTWIQNEWTAKF